MSLKNKLDRMKSHMNLENNEKKDKPAFAEKDAGNGSLPFLETWQENDTAAYWYDKEHCFIREVRYPIEYQHGMYSFKELNAIVSLWNGASLDHPLSAKGLAAEDLFFFDTETTGLGGGAGNTIFLLGYAFFEKDAIVVRQHILPQPGNEIPLYQSFLENINYETLVTYNGKAFDWPQLKTRHTLIKQHVPLLPDFGHFDLYHASRRLWKNKLEKVKLSAVEEKILGLKRENDIPGYLAPMIYFDFVERKDPEILFGVLKHNEIDVLSLITLYIHLSKQILQVNGYGEETLEIARWLAYLGKKEEAFETYNRLLLEGNAEERITAKHAIAYQKKKNNEYDSALGIWLEVAEKGTEKQKAEAILESCKLLEHHYKDYEKAIQLSFRLLAEIKGNSKALESDLFKRYERLKRKQNKHHF
ncbi:hypothetical protein ELQ35_10305 [Peribacillus cavernae]|uniref:YprB ribonuclease H-like domain-containing protein n=1 Tax=Peribacillus cavernae TaxID=1674310 RepID=A0A3S0VND9_9BACI|nr:ribonuclease H-like domain-containing protein [Peribacillus cavernae]MDQ0218942.1 uncharacterized protein YprB with RNaseH-like and TPR domain [Peribacillus cavernae]RUQ29348.1 hypothetical protein ELQ35_10305 [Peribacillus cavernae]